MEEKSNVMIVRIAAIFAAIFAIALIIFLIVPVNTGNSVSEQLSVGEEYLDGEDFEKAEAIFEGIIESEPECTEAYIALAKTYGNSGNQEKAVEKLLEGYEYTGSEKIYNSISEFEDLTATCSVESGHVSAESVFVKICAGKGSEVYYSLNNGNEKIYMGPIELKEGFNKIDIILKGKYSGRKAQDITYKYTVGVMPSEMKIEKYYKKADDKYQNVDSHYDGKINVMNFVGEKELYGTVDYNFKLIDPVKSETRISAYDLDNCVPEECAFWYTWEEKGIKNIFGDYIFENGTEGITVDYCAMASGGYDEKIIAFKDAVTEKWGIMNMLGEIILYPDFENSSYIGMTNADDGYVIATIGGDRALLSAVYAEAEETTEE